MAAALALFFFAPISHAQTTYGAETGNNTSACGPDRPAHCQNVGNVYGPGTGSNGYSTTSGTYIPFPGNVSKLDIHNLVKSGPTKIFAHFMPWFCTDTGSNPAPKTDYCNSHVQTGYTSNTDSAVLAQLRDIYSRGFNGVTPNYYGSQQTTYAINPRTHSSQKQGELETILRIRDQLNTGCSGTCGNMQMAVVYDQGSFRYICGFDDPQCVYNVMHDDFYDLNRYFFGQPSYVKVGGRPVVSTFMDESSWFGGCGSQVCTINTQRCTGSSDCWRVLYDHLRNYAATFSNGNPIFYFRNSGGFSHAQSDGGYFWANIVVGQPDYWDNTANNFYSTATNYVGRTSNSGAPYQIWGGAYKGTDHTNSAFQQGEAPNYKIIRQHCGLVWMDMLRYASDPQGFYEASHNPAASPYFTDSGPTLPYMQVITWNDYDEGTPVEPGIDNCLGISANMQSDGQTLQWNMNVSGDEPDRATEANEVTVDHYTVFRSNNDGTSGNNMTLSIVQDDIQGTHQINLGDYVFPQGGVPYTIYVKAVGQPGILNKMSNAVTYTPAAAQQPQVTLSPSALDFGDQTVGGTSPSQPVTLTNSGNAPLSISSITKTGDFTETNNCPMSPSTLAAGSHCTLTIAFAPVTSGTATGAVMITSNAPDSPHTIALAGNGVASGGGGSIGSDLDDASGWTSCTTSSCIGGNGGATTAIAQHLGSPSRDGGSMRLDLGGSTGYSNAQWTLPVTVTGSPMSFTYDFWLYLTNPANPQALSFTFSEKVSGRRYPFQLICDFNDTGKWKVWDPATSWVVTTAPCNRIAANTWTHFVLSFERTSSNWLHYRDVTVGNTTSTLDLYYNSKAESGADSAKVEIGLYGDSFQTDYSAWFDNLSVNASGTTTYSNLDQGTWASCAAPDCGYISQNVDPPSLDGAATEFHYGGTTAYTSAVWTNTLTGSFSNAKNYTLDTYAYMDTPTKSQAVAFNLDQIVGGQKYLFHHICDFKDTHMWKLWNPATSSWFTTTVGCSVFPASSWNHLVFHFERTSDNRVHYKDVVINGTVYTFDQYFNPVATSASDSLSVAVRLYGDSVPDNYSLWVDKMNLSY